MGQDKLILVIGRMERALSRLENGLMSVSASDSDEAVQEQYIQLRKATEQAIARIDTLIGRDGGING